MCAVLLNKDAKNDRVNKFNPWNLMSKTKSVLVWGKRGRKEDNGQLVPQLFKIKWVCMHSLVRGLCATDVQSPKSIILYF